MVIGCWSGARSVVVVAERKGLDPNAQEEVSLDGIGRWLDRLERLQGWERQHDQCRLERRGYQKSMLDPKCFEAIPGGKRCQVEDQQVGRNGNQFQQPGWPA
jgi:hypothetical protein